MTVTRQHALALLDLIDADEILNDPDIAPDIQDAAKALVAIRDESTDAATSVDLVSTLFDAIKHGDTQHEKWLRQAIEDHFMGRPVERPAKVPTLPIEEVHALAEVVAERLQPFIDIIAPIVLPVVTALGRGELRLEQDVVDSVSRIRILPNDDATRRAEDAEAKLQKLAYGVGRVLLDKSPTQAEAYANTPDQAQADVEKALAQAPPSVDIDVTFPTVEVWALLHMLPGDGDPLPGGIDPADYAQVRLNLLRWRDESPHPSITFTSKAMALLANLVPAEPPSRGGGPEGATAACQRVEAWRQAQSGPFSPLVWRTGDLPPAPDEAGESISLLILQVLGDGVRHVFEATPWLDSAGEMVWQTADNAPAWEVASAWAWLRGQPEGTAAACRRVEEWRQASVDQCKVPMRTIRNYESAMQLLANDAPIVWQTGGLPSLPQDEEAALLILTTGADGKPLVHFACAQRAHASWTDVHQAESDAKVRASGQTPHPRDPNGWYWAWAPTLEGRNGWAWLWGEP